MPKANFYMSEKDRKVILQLITDYIEMWEDCPMDEEEYNELIRVQKKIRLMENSKSYKNATIKNALEIANKILIEKKNRRKRFSLDLPTCITCKHWQEVKDEWIAYCPILKETTEGDESCNDFEDLED